MMKLQRDETRPRCWLVCGLPQIDLAATAERGAEQQGEHDWERAGASSSPRQKLTPIINRIG